MKKLFKKSLAVIMAVAMMICAIPFTASAAIYSGTCGDNLTWVLDTETGVLEISGTGDMENYAGFYDTPWRPYLSNITSVTIDSGVTTIGNYAFEYCENLVNVTFGENSQLTTIGAESFSLCTNLTNIILPKSLKKIGESAFLYTGIKNITITDNITNIGILAFGYCPYLEKIAVSSQNCYYSNDEYGVLFNYNKTTLVQYPAGNKQTDYVIPDSITRIDTCAFYGCQSLVSIDIPNSVTSIGYNAFTFCTGIKNIKLPERINAIDIRTFDNCTNLESIIIPASVTSIENLAFVGCTSLTNISFKKNSQLKTIGREVFLNCDNLKTVILPNGLTEIGGASFDDCFAHIPSSVTSIADGNDFSCICSDTEDCYAKAYAEENGIQFVLCDGNHHVCEYDNGIITTPATCTEPGVKTFTCECGNSYTEEIPAGHTPGEWEIMTEATVEHEGHKVKKCTVCQQIVEGVNIPRLVEIRDNESKIRAEIPGDMYNGNSVELSVEEAENDAAFEFVNKLNGRYMAYDIKILVNGEVTQPTGKVTVRVPIEGFVFGKYAVYHIDPETHEREELPCKREGNYIVFETDSFSYFVIADATEYEIQINQPSVTTINYGDTLILHADLGETALPEGYSILWTAEGTGVNINPSEDGLTCGVTSMQKGDVTVKATVVDENGEAITDADGNEITASQQLKSNVTFWQKIVSFFKNLFRISRIILQAK
ncbi:MAG: leucine-rich repeat domain-containing protein [Clostridia bacterium]|nr:leucine-rich repeat domain-containing protein [Clostridia bacterium]